jgi:long-chain fatty acid transport protein
MRARLSIGFLVLLATTRAEASGYHIDEQDARATGRGGAVIASPFNASNIYYNPGGLGTLQGLQINAGVSLVAPRADFRAALTNAETSIDKKVIPLPQIFASYRLGSVVTLGLGAYTPFGLKLEWPETSPGRQIVREIELRTYYVSPAVAANLSEWIPGLSLGATVDLVFAGVRLTRDILFGTDVATLALSANKFSAGASGGLFYRPKGFEQLALGVTYHSPVKLSFSGDANFTASPVFRSSLPPDGQTTTSITLPQSWSFGAAYRVAPQWELELDVDWFNWSSFESLVINLPGGTTVNLPKNWTNSTTIRFGTEMAIDKDWSIRLGGGWDKTPIPPTTLDFQLPDANRVFLTAGAGWQIAPVVRADIGALWIPPTSQTTSNDNPLQPPFKGTYDISVFVGGVTVGVLLDQKGEAPTTSPSPSPSPPTTTTTPTTTPPSAPSDLVPHPTPNPNLPPGPPPGPPTSPAPSPPPTTTPPPPSTLQPVPP